MFLLKYETNCVTLWYYVIKIKISRFPAFFSFSLLIPLPTRYHKMRYALYDKSRAVGYDLIDANIENNECSHFIASGYTTASSTCSWATAQRHLSIHLPLKYQHYYVYDDNFESGTLEL